MNCAQCQTPNQPNARFCLKCAAPMARIGGWAPSALGSPATGGATLGSAPTGAPSAASSGAAAYSAAAGYPGAPTSPHLALWLEGYVTFDGEVLEQFHFRESYCGRRHVATIADAQLKQGGSIHYIDVTTVFGAMNLMLPFRPEQRANAERLAHLLRSARQR